jgi:hypothetical protein
MKIRLSSPFVACSVCLLSLLHQGVASAQQTDAGDTGGQAASDFSLARPELTTDINELTEQIGTGFVGTNEQEELFFGASQAGENANNRSNRNFNTRSQSNNVNQGQTQPMYRTFGSNNVPYRSPHKIAFAVPESNGRVMNLIVEQRVRKLSVNLPQFRNVVFALPESRTVILKGFVPSESDKHLAQVYMKMEPGVDKVINQLQVGVPTPIPPAPALPSATQP